MGQARTAFCTKPGQTGMVVPAASTTVSTVGAIAQPGELVITNMGFKIAAGNTYTQGAGWNSIVKDNTFGFASEYRLDLPAGTASETSTTTVPSNWADAIAAFKPASSATGAVLDPGFYYFNGSGFAGGGGICLNGGSLLARDVTLQFVNQAGFSSRHLRPGSRAALPPTVRFGARPRSPFAESPHLSPHSPS